MIEYFEPGQLANAYGGTSPYVYDIDDMESTAELSPSHVGSEDLQELEMNIRSSGVFAEEVLDPILEGLSPFRE